MHILITDSNGDVFIVKKADIRRVYKNMSGYTLISFKGSDNATIRVSESVTDFYNINLVKKNIREELVDYEINKS